MTLALTADDTALRLAIAANPDDALARDAYLDFLCERADDGDGAAGVRAEFIRVQTELEPLSEAGHGYQTEKRCPFFEDRRKNPRPGAQVMPRCGKCDRVFELTDCVRDLLAAHEATWRAAGACPACVGTGSGTVPVAQSKRKVLVPGKCQSCLGTGDAGGLLPACEPLNQRNKCPYRYPVEFRRGHISAVTCQLADAIASDGKPTAWAEAVVKWFPVTEFKLTDDLIRTRDYGGGHETFAVYRGLLPGPVWDAMCPGAPPGVTFAERAELADIDAALARAVAAVVRAGRGHG